MAGRSITHSEQWWAGPNKPDTVTRCTAKLRGDGSQCRREAFPGMSVCGHHGGHLPVNIAKAFTRLGNSVEDAADVVGQIINDTSVPARDRLAAAQQVMKVLGMEKDRIEVKVSVDPIEELFRAIAADPNGLEQPNDGRASEAELEARREAWADLIGEDIVDAEVIEPSEDRTPAQIEAASQPDLPPTSGQTPKRIQASIDRELRNLL
ncbi:hypothetical protein [Nocardioides sp.]|uniref:hypothetical protein n=1 Tax=Nocardioides sp. TaxID=35761 RepID=UPI003567004E